VPRLSAGILLYRRGGEEGIELLLAHPGGPFFERRDRGSWTIPKGEYEPGEEPLAAAEREFAEEIGTVLPEGRRIPLGEVRQASGKRVQAFGVEGDLVAEEAVSNFFEMEWPPGSGEMGRFREIDRAAWFSPSEARVRLNASQSELVDRLLEALEASAPA
jgi:predicted NUDIX family NTP pyrophosphohydrolase